jgi:hypothetical protein
MKTNTLQTATITPLRSFRRIPAFLLFQCLLFAAIGFTKADQTVSGNLIVTGQADVQGNTFNLGTTSASGSPQGISFTFSDGSDTTPSTLTLGSSRAGNIWVWSHNSTGGMVPSMQLDNQNILSLFSTGNSTTPVIQFNPNSGGSITLNGSPVLTQGVANGLYISSSASQLLLSGPNFNVTSTGKVGIGTNTPAYPLVVKSGTSGFEFDAGNQVLGTTAGTAGGLLLNSGATASTAGSQGGQVFLGGSARSDATKGAIQFLSNGTEYMRIDGNATGHTAGNVGIGTSTPTQKLDVNGTIVSSATVYPNFQFNSARRITFGESDPQTADAGNVVQFGSGLNPARNMTLIISKSGLDSGFLGNNGSSFIIGEQSARPIIFKNNVSYAAADLLASGSERMRISASGDVGIGTPTPGGRLDVQGGFSFFNGLRLKGDDADVIFNGNTPLSLTVNNNVPITFKQYPSGEKMRIAANGSVGIGTNAPQALLHVAGNTLIDGTLNVGGVPVLTQVTANVLYVSSSASQLLLPGPNFNVTSSGKVGIGTNSPAYSLVVKSGSSGFEFDSTSQTIGTTLGTTGGLLLNSGATASASGTQGGQVFLGGSTRSDATKGAIQFLSNGTEYMRIDGNASGHTAGNVGIGTTSPAAKLDVNGNAALGTGVTSVAGQVVVGKYNDTRTSDNGTDHTQGVFTVGSGTATGTSAANALRVLADGTVLVKNSGDISMGTFTSGSQP